MSFEIGSLVVYPVAGFDLQQDYAAIQREAILRSITARGIKQMAEGHEKLRVTTSGSGWMPAGLNSIDRSQQWVVKCIKPRSVPANFSTRQATLPSSRRNDAGFTPWGYAVQPDGMAVKVGVTLVGNLATVEAVAGAVAYAVGYFPQITAYVSPPAESGDMGTATYRWEIVAEEV
jgi:hypothetical protein